MVFGVCCKCEVSGSAVTCSPPKHFTIHSVLCDWVGSTKPHCSSGFSDVSLIVIPISSNSSNVVSAVGTSTPARSSTVRLM